MRRVRLAALAGLLLAAPAAARDVPFLGGRVNDEARLLDASAAQALEATLKDYETRTGRQLAVLTIPSLEGEPLEEYSLKVARTWKLGRKDKDDGVLILVARDDRKVRIETGYGLEGALPDARAGRIISDVMVPRFRGGAYAAGLQEGAAAVISALDGSPSAPPFRTLFRPIKWWDLGLSLFILATFLLIDWGEIRTTGTDLSLYFCCALGLTVSADMLTAALGMERLQHDVGVFVLFLQFLGFPLAKFLISGTSWQKKRRGRHKDDFIFIGSGGSGGSGGGGGGFSGGGGSFGGGGASGSW